MNHRHRLLQATICSGLTLLLFGGRAAGNAAAPAPATPDAGIAAVIDAARDPAAKAVVEAHKNAITAAVYRRSHADAVAAVVESARGKVERVNTTPAALKQAVGHDLPQFESLRLVDLAVPNTGPHDHRKVDPYDAAFFERLGHIDTLESLNIISTKANDDWIAPLGKLQNLKVLRLTNNGKLTDAGLEKLAGLQNLEQFSYVGTGFKGHGFAKCAGWSKLVRCSFRGSSIDDEGLRLICEKLPNLESISLAHAKFTDVGAVHLAKLAKLKGLEIGSRNATPACLGHVSKLPLEYLQIGDGLDKPEGVALIKGMPTLRRLTLTDAKAMTDDDLKFVAGMTQLEGLELNNLAVPDDRLPLLESFRHLKALRLVSRPKALPPETQAKVKAALPKVELKFE